MIRVLRQYFTYVVTNPHLLEVNLDITMKVENQEYFLLPIEGYRADLKVTDSEGKQLIILSDKEFEKLSGNTMKSIIDLYLQKLKKDLI